MEYWGTEEIDENTGKVVKEWSDKYRELDNPIVTSGTSVKMNPVVTCPYCNSTNTKKISLTAKAVNTALFGIWVLRDISSGTVISAVASGKISIKIRHLFLGVFVILDIINCFSLCIPYI